VLIQELLLSAAMLLLEPPNPLLYFRIAGLHRPAAAACQFLVADAKPKGSHSGYSIYGHREKH
jgi:hypothetical protein